ncbi:MAG: acylase [Pedobacter sp.]|nr:MAG: acylase [Pedobacter sp.]
MKKLFLLFLLPLQLFAQKFTPAEIAAYQAQAKKVNIIRDKWGIPHIYGKTDADAVFGLLYAQCEDDFKRVELNYVEKLGRLAEINGESAVFNDLQIRLLFDSTEAKADYAKAQPSFKKLLDAYAAGINYYLHKNPKVKPALLTRFKPWFPLMWTDGSIGAINTADLTIEELKKFYTGDHLPTAYNPVIKDQHSGSNGFAFAPSMTESGNAILYINPHTTFYFRPEVQMQSEEGLNAYGAVTWGQFFVYQGFNEHLGWMHTSNNVDIADMYAEKITKTEKGLFYEYDKKKFPVTQKKINISYLDGTALKTKNFTAYFTNNGPVMAMREGKWISLKAKNRNAQSLVQSWIRTKAKSFEEYQKAMDLKANASNNTVYADAQGNIAFWHGNFIPIRDIKYNWSDVVDGTTSATAWKGLHNVKDMVHVYNPANGWLQNCNSTPFSSAGRNSPIKANYPSYMAPDGENFRGVAAVKLLSRPVKYTIEKVKATTEFAKSARPNDLLDPLKATIADLTKRFGKWQIAWGEVNRYQRLTGAIREKYDDNLPSLPVGFGSAMWGQLGSYISNPFKTNKRYGYSGNSFVCVVEFGKRIKAKSILAGGNSGNPNSKHFTDQALMYTKGEFKDVLFYKEDVLKHMERSYQPGQ